MGNERETEAANQALKAEYMAKVKDPNLNLTCKHCGNQLEPRKFEYDDELLWGIFDNCEPFDKQMLYPTLTEAILAFNGVPEGERDIENLIKKYTHG